MKILIVEDDREYRTLLYDYLHSLGHDVLAVSDAIHAVALLTDHSDEIGLVLLDLMMPRLSGDQLLQTFAYWNTCRTRFLIVSGSLEIEPFEGHPKLVGILRKPFQFSELGNIIQAEEKRPKGL
jgi:two-component system, cell cycle sensor histidine kinase and response regulator CckA